MSQTLDFDRIVADWLRSDGSADVRSEVVDRAVESTRATRQRHGLAAALVGPAPWPGYGRRIGFGALSPALRVTVLLALLVALLIGVAFVGSQVPRLVRVVEQPTPAVGAPAWDSIYRRPDSADVSLIDVVLVRPDGSERLLRRVPALYPLGGFEVSLNGWLAIYNESEGNVPLGAYRLIDLTQTERAPLTVPYPGLTGTPAIMGRWSPSGLFALSNAQAQAVPGWRNIDVVDPLTGVSTHLGEVNLFGDELSIVWAADSSGILDGARLTPVSSGPDRDVDPALRFTDRRVGSGPVYVEAASEVTVRSFTGQATVWYASRDAAEHATSAAFARDGRSLLVVLDRTSEVGHTAVVARIDAPGAIPIVLATWDLPAGGYQPVLDLVDPDDASFAISYQTGSRESPEYVDGRILSLDGRLVSRSHGSFIGYVPGPLAESWPAEGDFVQVSE
jgi:hypothetical protein